MNGMNRSFHLGIAFSNNIGTEFGQDECFFIIVNKNVQQVGKASPEYSVDNKLLSYNVLTALIFLSTSGLLNWTPEEKSK